jgi:hypothetical protein
MQATTAQIDITRLDKLRRHGHKITARCPACAAEGGDKAGAHFFQNTETGQFGCAKFPGDSEHRREIFRIVGICGERDPAEEREWRRGRVKMAAEQHARRKVSHALRAKRAAIIAAHPWTESEARADSPEKRLGWLHDPRRFIAALFPPAALVWTGETNMSGTWKNGKTFEDRWRTAAEWLEAPEHTVGPMIAPATWQPGTVSRAAEHVATAPFVVCDFDGFDGNQPGTPAELREHIAASLAITRWLREALGWQLAAVLFTGSKSIHAWFHAPPPEALESLRHTADALGVDAGLIGHPEHPCRLPGWLHAKTGKPSRVLWLQSPT